MANPVDKKKAHRSSTQILEESVAMLRRTPFWVLVIYYLGALPFWLAVLYFLSDMSRNAYAAERLASASLVVGGLFIWMKCWHCVFTDHLRVSLLLEAGEPWTAERVFRMILAQCAIQPWGLIVRPVALLITLPFVWISSFYQNATIFGNGRSLDGESVAARAWKRACLWPRQAHLIVLMLSIFGFFIWLNVVCMIFAVPALLKGLFGIETMLSRNPGALLNTTFFTATYALTLLCLDPLWKAGYVLRCFYGDSLETGDDLRLRLRSLRAKAARLVLIIFAAATAASALAPTAYAAEPQAAAAAPAAPAVDPEKLSRSIDDVLDRREYAWRMPRRIEAQKKGAFASWLDDVAKMLEEKIKQLRHLLKRLFDWLFKGKQGKPPEMGGVGEVPWRGIIYVLIGAGLVALGWAIWRMWSTRGGGTVVTAEAVRAMPDLHSEDVVADQMPEDSWLQFARELMERGELRLALRAAYLACLAHLGQRQLLTIARYKSNRDYDRELHRRARSRDELLTAFDDNLSVFERAWYGSHDVDYEMLARFTQNLEKIRAC